jgi:eukaryotic-like serine/threonine-protein kinase
MRLCPQCNTPYPDDHTKCIRDGTILVTLNDAKKTSVEPTMDTLIGSLIGNYRLQKLLGTGGMGSVYLATHISVGKEVAIKIIKESESQSPTLVERFFREARSIAKIHHENVIELLDFGTTPEGRFYLVVELLTGKDLAELLNEQPILPIKRAIHITRQIANGLESAHQQKIVHRDLKPENVFLTSFRGDPDLVKILDFGIAKDLNDLPLGERGMTDPGKFLGTPLYMAPEQGAEVDSRSDVYSLGLILYRMVTGELAFRSGNLADLIYKHLTQPVPSPCSLNPAISEGLEQVIIKALAKSKTERYSSMREFSQALGAVSDDSVEAPSVPASNLSRERPPTMTTLSGSIGEAQPRATKRRALLWVGGLAVVLGGVAVSVLHWSSAPMRSAPTTLILAEQLNIPLSLRTSQSSPTLVSPPASVVVAQPTSSTLPALPESKKSKKIKKVKGFVDVPNTGL